MQNLNQNTVAGRGFIKRIFLSIVIQILIFNHATAQVRVRIFADKTPGSALFSVTAGEYQIDTYRGNLISLKAGSLTVITKSGNRLAIKVMNQKVFLCDSVLLKGKTGDDRFSLRINSGNPVRQSYCGDLQCLPDMGTLVFVNICDVGSYIAGVVRSEGGPGRHIEYFKTQAVIVRTYMYRNMQRHAADGFNLCDNTHCQAFNGITTDSIIIRAAKDTKDQVIARPDSVPIIAAFHSNCGGETVPSEKVWLTPQPYLRKVTDPHCMSSRNSKWRQSFGIDEWLRYLEHSGHTGDKSNRGLLNFSQITRSDNYRTGSYSIPFRQIRNDLSLKSAFFSVTVQGDSVILNGRGYGHGVGLCQEGAMAMALKGFSYRQITGFYYTGVIIIDINDLPER